MDVIVLNIQGQTVENSICAFGETAEVRNVIIVTPLQIDKRDPAVKYGGFSLKLTPDTICEKQ